MGTPNKSIVVGIDYTELGDLALETACNYAGPDVHVHVVHIVPSIADETGTKAPAASQLEEESERLHVRSETVVKNWCKAHSVETPFSQLTTHIRSGHPAQAIAQLASDIEADLVVVGTHGRRGAQRFLLGSVAESTVRLAPCPVLVARPPNAGIPQIEPPCPRCVEARKASNGQELWCDQHAQHHEPRHTYHYRSGGESHQSGFFIH